MIKKVVFTFSKSGGIESRHSFDGREKVLCPHNNIYILDATSYFYSADIF
jgi:hypothetical protein